MSRDVFYMREKFDININCKLSICNIRLTNCCSEGRCGTGGCRKL
jgi:hypothetical protein